jgi:hypothetical protein
MEDQGVAPSSPSPGHRRSAVEPVPVSSKAGTPNAGSDPGRECQCRLCRYDDEFAAHIEDVPQPHRSFFEELKERWEAADFDATWFRGCVGGEEYTVEFCERYDAQRARVTRRHRDSDSDPQGENSRSEVEGSASQSGAENTAHRPTQSGAPHE